MSPVDSHNKCPGGALSCAQGTIPFGPAHPTLLVNDQTGYYCELDDVRAKLREGRFDELMDLFSEGIQAGLRVVNVQLMEPSLDEAALVPDVVALLHETFGCGIAIDSREPDIVDAALRAPTRIGPSAIASPVSARCWR